MHVSLLLRVVVKFDIDIHSDSLPDVLDKVYRALYQICSEFLQVLDLDSVKLKWFTSGYDFNDFFCLDADLITADNLMDFASDFC